MRDKFVYTYDGFGNGIIYINGDLDVSSIYMRTADKSNDDAWIIGKLNTEYIKGILDEITIWNISLSESDFHRLYESGMNYFFQIKLLKNSIIFVISSCSLFVVFVI